jgi:hypothetical protein
LSGLRSRVAWAGENRGHGGTKHHPASLLEKFLGRRSRTDWLTADVASKALAAAQLVAAWNSHPSPNLPEGILALLRQHQSSFRMDFVTLAQQAVAIVKTNSELKELWDETDATEWNKVIADLESRLSAS